MPAPPESKYDKAQTLFTRVLECLEFGTVVVLSVVILGVAIGEGYWVFLQDRCATQARLASAIRLMNENWKVGLLLLVPLFYRTVRGFLERVEKFMGAEAPHTPKSTSPEAENPVPDAKNSEEQDL